MSTAPRLNVLYQDEIVRGIDPAPAIAGAGARPWRIETARWREDLDRIAEASSGERHLLFVTLPVARHVRRAVPGLAGGVILRPEILRHHVYSAALPADLLLNPRGIYLPWGRLPGEAGALSTLFGDHLFIRPDSPMKPFTGFDVRVGDLGREHAALSQTDRVEAAEMCFIAPARPMPSRETRVWCVEGRAVTSAAYGWSREAETGDRADPGILAAAERVAAALEYHERILTADFAVLDGAPKLVEINATSTSGWYRGMDAAALLAALETEML